MENLKYFYIILLLFGSISVMGQTQEQNNMEQLNFMIGEWIGVSSIMDNDTILKQGPIFEKIEYKLDKNLITIDLNSSMLQLHTVIYYDVDDKKYYYCPYSKGKAGGKYPGEFKDEKFIVWFNENYKLVFQLTPEGDFIEYGEKFKNGLWVKNFKDVLKKAP